MPRGDGINFRLITLAVCFFFLTPQIVRSQPARDAASFYEEGREAMSAEDRYAALEAFLECLRRNPAHTAATAAIAEVYYELGEYDEALSWVRKARALARRSTETANLEAFILIATGRLAEADNVIKDVLSREPYNREALFAASELDIARGRSADAVSRYKSAVRLYGDDRRLLVSLALVLGSLGDYRGAAQYIERAQTAHPDDYRVCYFSAYLAARSGKLSQAIRDAERALFLKPGYVPARDLLASLRYRSGDYDTAMRYADEAISERRDNITARFLKGMALWRLGRNSDALSAFRAALNIDGGDEFTRAAFEDLIIADTPLESTERKQPAAYHFDRAKDYKRRNLSLEAIFEYRRGLRINPYADERRDYAELLRLQGYPAGALDELKFMVDLGKGTRAVNDSIETYTNLLSTTLSRRRPVNRDEMERHWNVAIFSIAGQSAFYHTDSGFIAASYLRDVLSHSRVLNVMNLELREPTFAAAFRTAREASEDGKRCDYFMLTSVSESERAVSFKAELFVARTGAKAAEWTIYRTGQDRLRGAALNIASRLEDALPFRAVLLRRDADRGLIDKGKADKVADAAVFDLIKKGKLELKSEGIGFKYLPDDVAGTFTVNEIDEEIAAGTLVRQGFFDMISPGDDIIERAKTDDSKPVAGKPAGTTDTDPELRTLLRTLRAQ